MKDSRNLRKKNNKLKEISPELCKKCWSSMERRSYKEKPTDKSYFLFWDRCYNCKTNWMYPEQLVKI